MKNNIIIVGVGLVAVLALILAMGNKPQSPITIGATSSLTEVDVPYTKIGGLEVYHYAQPMIATSSVVCSIKNPYKATSTVNYYTAQATANGLGTQKLNLSTSTTAYASSSPYLVKEFVTGAGQFSMAWARGATTTNTTLIGTSVSNNVGNSDIILGPSEFLNLGIATSTPIAGTFTSYLTGTCRGQIQKL